MTGTRTGGKKCSTTNKLRHGNDFYKRIGSIGGKRSTTGGFASNVIGADGLTGRERAKIAGRKCGLISKRKPSRKVQNDN